MNKINRNSVPVNRTVVKTKNKVKQRKKDNSEGECNGVTEENLKHTNISKAGVNNNAMSGKNNIVMASKHLHNGTPSPNKSGTSAGSVSSSKAGSATNKLRNISKSTTEDVSGDERLNKSHSHSSSVSSHPSSIGHEDSDESNLSSTGNFGDRKYDCTFCSLHFSSLAELQCHCRSQEHQTTIMSDNGHEWKYRPPPRGLATADYRLCSSVGQSWPLKCRLAQQCIGAHSEAELVEWRERFDYRALKLQEAKEKQLHGGSYADQLLDRFSNAKQQHSIVTDKVGHLIMLSIYNIHNYILCIGASTY